MIVQVLAILILLGVFVYLKGVYNERYWKKRGVVFHKSNRLLGISWDYLTQNRAFFEHFDDIYKQYPNEPAIGIGSVLKPAIFLRDVNNIQHVVSTDFNAFNHRGFEISDDDKLANNILLLNGKKWKLLRQSMSPLFTSSKLKLMYNIINKSAEDIVPYIKSSPELMKRNTFDTLSTFCSAAITAAVFGISSKSVFDSPFLEMAQRVFKPTLLLNIKFVISLTTPMVMRLLNLKFFSEYEPFFIGAIKQLLVTRRTESTKRHDFADLCVSIQDSGMLKDEDTGLEIKPTDEVLAAQAFFFFTAGVEPTATAMYNVLILLGKHPEALKRLQDEIDDAFAKNNGSMTYDALSGMEYLDMVFNEASRMYPALGYIVRECVHDSVLPAGNIKIEKGTTVFIPIFAVHHDEKFYPDPEVFKPERFSRDNKSDLVDKAFLPFGKGNRICIGMRYATLQAKAGLVQLLRNFDIKTEQIGDKIQYRKEQIQVRIVNVDFQFVERKIKSN
ncbi:cytochrome P450 6B5-like [Aricia agestis]|uniref:cytochrome P450 6B5-like n=1 Tax=Aricia agestis TaxID=91739 RepID=UPI001C208F7F|nr:cytochrome P450 6B5-like [Aricia agestis]